MLLSSSLKTKNYPPNHLNALFPLSRPKSRSDPFPMSSNGRFLSPDRRGLRALLRILNPPTPSTDQNPLISSPPSHQIKKTAFVTAAFRTLSCSSSEASQAYAPSSAASAVRSSADWEEKRPRRRMAKQRKRDRSSPAADMWCAPGISFAGDDSVDCVLSHREIAGRGGRVEAERTLRELTYCRGRGGSQDPVFSMEDSVSSLQASLYQSHPMPSEHYNLIRGYNLQPPIELEEIMLLRHRLLMRGGDTHDRYRDLRLDVDRMSYEELLELGEKIGHVSTGLREEEITYSIRKVKHLIFDKLLSNEMERKCSICQEEYEIVDELGKLGCGHSYHICCIRKWLLHKNACPVCKAAVIRA